jgi:hypothetical protein
MSVVVLDRARDRLQQLDEHTSGRHTARIAATDHLLPPRPDASSNSPAPLRGAPRNEPLTHHLGLTR